MEKKFDFMVVTGWISRVLVGVVFVFSGFVKAIDPLGSTYKFSDYFSAYGFGFLEPAALFFAILLSAAELTIGLALLFSIRIKVSTWGALIFMIVFLPLTLVSALTNKVSDCGCFGDALLLTNWETFWKNVIIIIPVLLAFFTRKKPEPRLKPVPEWVFFMLFIVFSVSLSVYGLRHLPMIDFRPYNIGTSISDGMKIPEGAPQDEYQISAVYQKDGVKKEFPYPDFPDSTWTWVETKNILIKKGYEPPINNFNISGIDGSSFTEKILTDPGISILLISPDLEKADMSKQKELNDLALIADSRNISFYCITGSGEEVIRSFEKNAETTYPFLQADEIMLKTLVRSNPGLVFLKQGTVVGMWASGDIPESEQIKDKDLLAFAVSSLRERETKLVWLAAGLFMLLLGAFITVLQGWCNIRKQC